MSDRIKVVETVCVCERCGSVWVHHEAMPEWDEPYGVSEQGLVCDCGGRLTTAPEGKMDEWRETA